MAFWTSVLSEAVPAANSALVSMSLMSKGLLTTVIGLLGVFMVLSLFFVTIKLMQRIKPREKGEKA